jgi:hypothetical protein
MMDKALVPLIESAKPEEVTQKDIPAPDSMDIHFKSKFQCFLKLNFSTVQCSYLKKCHFINPPPTHQTYPGVNLQLSILT